MLALGSIARLAPRLLVVQTLTMPGEALHEAAQEPLDFEDPWRMAEPGWPLMAFIEGAFAGEPTNWWAPNRACTVAMLRNVGFDVVAEPGHEIFVCRNRDPRRPPPFWTAEWEAATGLVRWCAGRLLMLRQARHEKKPDGPAGGGFSTSAAARARARRDRPG